MTGEISTADALYAAHAEAVGRVAIASAYLEDVTRLLYANMIESNISYLAAAGHSFAFLNNACTAIQRETGWHPDNDGINQALTRSRNLYAQRNQIVHAVWLHVVGHGQHLSYRTRLGKSHAEAKNWTLEEMRTVAADLADAGDKLREFTRRP